MTNGAYMQKEIIDLRLQNLASISQIPQPTKMELFSKRRMLGRVQRQENKRFRQEITRQQKDFTQRKKQIETYLFNLEKEKARRAQILADYYATEYEKEEKISLVPTFPALPTFDIKPIQKFPIQIKTRLSQRPRLQDPSIRRITRMPRPMKVATKRRY